MIVITIDLGSGALWISTLFVFFWLLYLAVRAAIVWERKMNERAVNKCATWMLRSPHIALGPPQYVNRPTHEFGMIRPRYSLSEEEEMAA